MNNETTPQLPVKVWEKFIEDAKWSINFHTAKLEGARAQLQAGEIALEQARSRTENAEADHA